MTHEELKKVAESHRQWLAGEPDGERANLRGADLKGADLRVADLRGADLKGADLRGADLWGVDLTGANLNWQSHALLAEVLRQAAGDSIPRRKLAGLVLISRDWCWRKFLAIDDPEREWAISVLRSYRTERSLGPDCLSGPQES